MTRIRSYLRRVALAHRLALLKKWYTAGPTVPSWDDFREVLAAAWTAVYQLAGFLLLVAALITCPVWWPVWAIIRALFGPLICAYLNSEKDITDCIGRHTQNQ